MMTTVKKLKYRVAWRLLAHQQGRAVEMENQGSASYAVPPHGRPEIGDDSRRKPTMSLRVISGFSDLVFHVLAHADLSGAPADLFDVG
jgi:hypothetical protein